MTETNGKATLIEATGVFAGYGEVDILHGVSACVYEGEMVAIIGPNGAGKSTLLRTMFGLLHVRETRRRAGVRVAGHGRGHEPGSRTRAQIPGPRCAPPRERLD